MPEKQSMMHLEIVSISDGFDLLKAQQELQKRLHELECYDYPPHIPAETRGDLLASVRFNDEAIDSERQEVMDRLPWKRWKKSHREGLNEPVSDEDRYEIKFELIDELHFLTNKMISAGFESWEEVERWYLTKNRENFARQERNY